MRRNPTSPCPASSSLSCKAQPRQTSTPIFTNADSYINETLDVTSSFQFGAPFAFGAETQTVVHSYAQYATGVDAGVNSSIQLTGFTVLDASGNIVADAQLIPREALGTGIFTPEPFSGSLALLGFAALLCPLARYRRKV